MVAPFYDPNGTVNDSPTSINATCFSSQHFSNDITDKITAITSTGAINGWNNENTVNGVYVKWDSNMWCSLKTTNPWIQYDFGRVVIIQKIIIKLRATNYPQFENVEIRVGKTSASGDFSQFRLFDKFLDVGVNGEVHVFEASKPLRGQYLSLQRLGISGTVNIAIGNINILGKA